MKKVVCEMIVTVFAIGAITTLELYALSKGINGVALAGSIGAVCGLGGYEIKKLKDKITGK